MKDRQFMAMLSLVVAAGLVMGLIAFRMTGGSAPVAGETTGNSAVANPNAPRPSAADAEVDAPPVDATPLAAGTDSQNGEPAPESKDAPEMQGPGSGDPPGTAYDPQQPPPPDTASDVTPPSTDAPPQ